MNRFIEAPLGRVIDTETGKVVFLVDLTESTLQKSAAYMELLLKSLNKETEQ